MGAESVSNPKGLTEAEKDKLRVRYLDKGRGLAYRKLDGRRERRVVVEDLLDRPFTNRKYTHHEDLDKGNNNSRNLIIFSPSSWHTRHHSLRHVGLDICDCECICPREVI